GNSYNAASIALTVAPSSPPPKDFPPSLGSKNGFFLTPPTNFASAATFCQSSKGNLADLTSDNFNAATTAAFNLVGANTALWLASWNGDNYKGTPIALTTGNSAPGGSINQVDPNSSFQALCKGTSFTPPQTCVERSRPFVKENKRYENTYIVCRSDTSSAWISSSPNAYGGKYEFKKICEELGYSGIVTEFGGNWGT
ncbi:hypothetical protein HK096_001668, partial [Nowakowskiella sp. JEL0078]